MIKDIVKSELVALTCEVMRTINVPVNSFKVEGNLISGNILTYNKRFRLKFKVSDLFYTVSVNDEATLSLNDYKEIRRLNHDKLVECIALAVNLQHEREQAP
jgi:hypothetical protein